MEELLKKLAKQLLAMDEASLTTLWNKYYNIVMKFEPTKRWEEAAVILCMIQAIKWKNQLFNIKLISHTQAKKRFSTDLMDFKGPGALEVKSSKLPLPKGQDRPKKAKILHFKPTKQ